jgi:hypothetical protein
VTHLRQAMLEELQRRNYAKTTVYYYLKAVERFAKHFYRFRTSSITRTYASIRPTCCASDDSCRAWCNSTCRRSGSSS